MKKLFALALALILPLAAAGCGNAAPSAADEAAGAASDSDRPAYEIGTTTVGDTSMDYLKFGTGDKSFVIIPGLSVHSVMGAADAIANAYKALCDDYTIYLFEPKTESESCTIRSTAADIAAAMEAQQIESAVVFGASRGGMVAEYIAIDRPELVDKLILGSTLARGNDTSRTVIGNWIDLAVAHDETALLESFVDTVYSDATLSAYRDTLIESNRGITDEEYSAFVIAAQAVRDFDCYDELSSITCPTLVIGSLGDRVVTADASREIADVLGCEIYLYPDTYGHAVYDEAPDYIARCAEFLEK